MQAILLTFGNRDDLRIWRNNCGVARRGKQLIRFGVPGQADISGIMQGGRRLEIECKAGTRQTKEQRAFQAMIERFGGLYVLAKSTDDVAKVL